MELGGQPEVRSARVQNHLPDFWKWRNPGLAPLLHLDIKAHPILLRLIHSHTFSCATAKLLRCLASRWHDKYVIVSISSCITCIRLQLVFCLVDKSSNVLKLCRHLFLSPVSTNLRKADIELPVICLNGILRSFLAADLVESPKFLFDLVYIGQ